MDSAGMEFLLEAVDRFPVKEEFTDNLEQQDPILFPFLLENGAANAKGGDSDAGSGMAQKVGGDGAIGAQEGACRRAASPTRSAKSIDRVNPEAPRWTKRLRLGRVPPDRTPCLPG
ncbi:hypothetical protein VPH35_074728 [Triticum aestivum]